MILRTTRKRDGERNDETKRKDDERRKHEQQNDVEFGFVDFSFRTQNDFADFNVRIRNDFGFGFADFMFRTLIDFCGRRVDEAVATARLPAGDVLVVADETAVGRRVLEDRHAQHDAVKDF